MNGDFEQKGIAKKLWEDFLETPFLKLTVKDPRVFVKASF